MTDQMYFDGKPDSFLSEVIQILKVYEVSIRIDYGVEDPYNRVKIKFEGEQPSSGHIFSTEQVGRSYGEALKKIREEIREVIGK